MGIWDSVSKFTNSITPDALSESKRAARYMIIGLAFVTAADGEVDEGEKAYAGNFVKSQPDIMKYFPEQDALSVFNEHLQKALSAHQTNMFVDANERAAKDAKKNITDAAFRTTILRAMENISSQNDRGQAGQDEQRVINIWRNELA